MGIVMIFGSFFAALGQISDPEFRKVLGKGVLLTIALLIGFYAAFLYLLTSLGAFSWVSDTIGSVGWLTGILTWASLALVVFLSTLLMVPVASAMTSLFLDEIAEAVEVKHYPHLPKVARVSFWVGVKDSVNFLGWIILVNVFAAILAIMFLPLAALIFWAANGYLLGREYFQITAMRRLGRDGAKAEFRKHRGTIWLAGFFMAVPLTIPLVNLVIPILGAATFTHLFHRLMGSPSGRTSRDP